MEAMMRDIRRGLWSAAIGVVMLVGATYIHADEPGDVRGCYISYVGNGKFLYEPFLKVADKESYSQDGESEVWGFRPWNLEPTDKDGKTKPVNIPEDRFIPLRVFKEVNQGSLRKYVKCPEGLW